MGWFGLSVFLLAYGPVGPAKLVHRMSNFTDGSSQIHETTYQAINKWAVDDNSVEKHATQGVVQEKKLSDIGKFLTIINTTMSKKCRRVLSTSSTPEGDPVGQTNKYAAFLEVTCVDCYPTS
jgi:hypothetical protein